MKTENQIKAMIVSWVRTIDKFEKECADNDEAIIILKASISCAEIILKDIGNKFPDDIIDKVASGYDELTDRITEIMHYKKPTQ